MVEFLTFFLGLATGVHRVELNVTGPVAAVEVRLSGKTLATLTAAPWVVDCDLGQRPLPHDLVAIARDAQGRELDRAEQWINMEMLRTVASLAVDTDAEGRARALAVDWQSIGEPEPQQIAATFNGRPLDVTDPGHIPLPAHDGKDFHYVSADLEFSESRSSRRETEFGGIRTQRISSQLTAVVVSVDRWTGLPPMGRMGSWFLKDGEPLEIHGVDKGVIDLFVVRGPGAQAALDELARAVVHSGFAPKQGQIATLNDWHPATFFSGPRETVKARIRDHRAALMPLRDFAPFSHKLRLNFVSPRPGMVSPAGITPDTFLHSRAYAAGEGGLSWLVRRQPPMSFAPKIREAVAVAGTNARAGNRRRAVLLVIAAGEADSSDYSVADTRELLRALQVPLYVWSLGSPDPEWGEVTDLGDPSTSKPLKVVERLRRATIALQRDLKAQRVFWLEGRHLPQRIELAPDARGVRLAGL